IELSSSELFNVFRHSQPPSPPELARQKAHATTPMTTMTSARAVLRFLRRCSGVMLGAFLACYLTIGGSTKVWKGAGDGTVHSRPVAPSHGLAGAGSPRPFQALRVRNRKISCEKPKKKAPMVAISLKSVNCAG